MLEENVLKTNTINIKQQCVQMLMLGFPWCWFRGKIQQQGKALQSFSLLWEGNTNTQQALQSNAFGISMAQLQI